MPDPTPMPATPPPPQPPAEDIFANVDPQQPAKGWPAVTPPPPVPPVPSQLATPPKPLEPLQGLPELEGEGSGGKRKLFVALGAVAAVIVVGVGGWYAFSQLSQRAPATNGDTTPPVPTSTPPAQDVDVTPTTTPPVAGNQDSDSDGLTDAEEQQLSTDPFQVDTDGDSLNDRDEVNVWHTDPLNPDSDGDGYLDGAEIRGGYDPKGPGKLLNLPTSTQP
jgi:hypothetical protein